MRAAFLTAETVMADPDRTAVLRLLQEAGLQPVIVVQRPLPEGERLDSSGFPVVTARGDSAGGDDEAGLLIEAALKAASTAHEIMSVSDAFLVGRNIADVQLGALAGCRPVLILAGRTLDEALGVEEPGVKHMVVAADLPTAARYMLQETEQERDLGAFPYATPHTLEERAVTVLPSQGDLAKIFAVIILAGLAVALGLAYLLKEIYKTYTFPPIAFYLTLQFISPAWRGALFLLLGALLGLFLPRLLSGIQRRAYR